METQTKNQEKEQILTEVDIEKEAINLVRGEWRAYDNQLVFVTDKVAFNMRNLIKTLRKNYWGIFDNPNDPVTGMKLTWVPITEWIVDTYVKNSDRDQKDMRVKAKSAGYVALTSLVRHIVVNWMSKVIFGETLDETERQLGIDGSRIWKIYKGYDEKGKATAIREDVDLLNAYFDMSAKSIQAAPRFTERALMLPSEIADMDGWINTENIVGSTNLHPTDTNMGSTAMANTTDAVKLADVWEMWGVMPKYLITGKKADSRMIKGHIVVSGIQGDGENARVHLIETNPGGKKPYEEAHTKKIAGRWLARGPAESVLMIQGWLNMIVNIRKVRASVSQLGIFKLKKGGGVSPQNFSKMAANGVIQVNSMDDIEQFVVQEASQASYKDEDTAVGWATKVTSSYEAVTGEPTPGSKSATAIITEKAASGSTFTMYKKAIGFFLERVMNNHILPILTEQLTIGEIVRISGTPEELEMYTDAIVNCLAKEQLAKAFDKGMQFDPKQVAAEIERVKKQMMRQGKDRFFALGKIDLTQYDVEFYSDDEKLDSNTIANNLTTMLKFTPQYQGVVTKYLFDIMGLDSSIIPNQPVAAAPAAPGGGAAPVAVDQGGGY